MPITPLPAVPVQAYHPATYRGHVGHYAGEIHEVRWGYYKGWAHGQVRRALVRKRWFQVVLPLKRHTLIVRLQDNGTTGHGRVIVLDREAGGTVVDVIGSGAPLRTMVVGFMAGEGADGFLRNGGPTIELQRGESDPTWSLKVDVDGLSLDLELESLDAPTPSLVIGEALDPFRHRPGLSQRSMSLAVSGSGRLRGVPIDVDGAAANLVYTNVFLAPSVRTQLITGSTLDVGIAISDGNLFGDTQESTLFIGGKPHALPRVHLLQEGAERAWKARSADGSVDLSFEPQALHRATDIRRFGRVHHDSTWVAGRLTGKVPGPKKSVKIDMVALAEEHRLQG